MGKTFLAQISSPLSEDCWIPSLSYPVEKYDLGRYLSSLHTILFENVSKLPTDNAKSVKLRELLDDISNILKRPTIPQLEQISQPTMTTLAERTAQQQPKSGGGIRSTISNVFGTLPKKKTTSSVPAPHHTKSTTFILPKTPKNTDSPMHGLGVSEGVSLSSSSTSDTTSNPSLNHSPGGHMTTPRNWRTEEGASSTTSSDSSVIIGTGRHSHDFMEIKRRSSKMKFPSSMSLDETDSSDDSTYSSQYQSDANSTPRTGTSHTLPRHLPTTRSSMTSSSGASNNHQGITGGGTSVVKVKSMSDYETEILQMRSEMEQLQSKLVEAERQIQFNHVSNNHHQRNNEVEAKEVVDKLKREEDKLRREQLERTSEDPIADKERMILMQQKKIAALDSANKRLLEELTRMTQMTSAASTKVSVTTNPSSGLNVTSINTSSNTVSHDRRVSSSSTSSNKSITVITNGEATVTTPTTNNQHAKSNSLTQETPKTVDELLDSLHSTSI